MEQKNSVILEFPRGERIYRVIVPDRAPFGEIFDVAFEFLDSAHNYQVQAMEKVKKEIEEAKKKAEPIPVEAEVK